MDVHFFRKNFLYITLLSSSLFAQKYSPLPPSSIPTQTPQDFSLRIPRDPPKSFGIKGNFTYWQPIQENMELGIIGNTSDSTNIVDGKELNLNISYASGFQVAISTDLPTDHWEMSLEYTWFRNKDHVSKNLDPSNSFISLYPAWEVPSVNTPTYFSGEEEWKLHMDFLELSLGRNYLVGEKLALRPFIGLRAPWIRQRLKVDYIQSVDDPFQNSHIRQSFYSWGVGPRTGVSLDWFLWKELRLIGQTGADIVYTQYRKLLFQQFFTTTNNQLAPASRIIIKQNRTNHIRSHIDMSLGIGWGFFFSNNRRHVDFSLNYGFQIFFSQNMFRNFVNDQSIAKNIAPNGDLTIQGLTATVLADF